MKRASNRSVTFGRDQEIKPCATVTGAGETSVHVEHTDIDPDSGFGGWQMEIDRKEEDMRGSDNESFSVR